jgi:peptidoglycan hydrolase-like protein with peptidoglycan-binding domain
LIQQIQQVLIYNNYAIDENELNGTFGPKTQSALALYQRQNQLPIGNLNIKTLDHMAIEYQLNY